MSLSISNLRDALERPPPPRSQIAGASQRPKRPTEPFRSMVPPPPWIMRGENALLALGVIVLAAIFALVIASAASAHDDGKFAGSPLKAWFDHLASGKGLCCSFADGVSVQDVDWDTASVADAGGQSHVVYRVRLNKQWIVVPPEAVVTEPNKFGAAVVWPYQDMNGVTQIRCFIPGAGA